MKIIKLVGNPWVMYFLSVCVRGPVGACTTIYHDIEQVYGKCAAVLAIYIGVRAGESVIKCILNMVIFVMSAVVMYMDIF